MRYRHRVLILLFFLAIITYLDRVCVAVAGPEMQKDLGITPEQWGWVVGVFAITYALFEIPSGALGDRIGPRKVLTRIVIWWSTFTFLTGTVKNFRWLLVTQMAFGAGEAGAFPNASGAISRWFPKTERGRAQGVVWMASRIGGAISPLLVIPIQAAWGWRASFWTFSILGIIWAIIWYAWMRDTPREKPGVTEAEIAEIEEGQTPVKAHRSLPLSVLKSANFWFILAMYHTYVWGSYFFLSWLHTFLAKGRGFTPEDLRTWSPLPFVFGMAATFSGGLVSDALVKRIGLKWGRRLVGFFGLTFSAICMALETFITGKIASVLVLSLAYFGSDFMLPVAWAVCLDVGRKYAGAVTGSMNMAGQFGSFLSAVVFGYLIEGFGTYNAILLPMAGMLLLSALLWLKIDPTKELVPEPESTVSAATA